MKKFTSLQKLEIEYLKKDLKEKSLKAVIKAENYYLSGQIFNIKTLYNLINNLKGGKSKRIEARNKLKEYGTKEPFREKKQEFKLITNLEANQPTKIKREDRIINKINTIFEGDLPESTLHLTKRKFDRQALNGAFHDTIMHGDLVNIYNKMDDSFEYVDFPKFEKIITRIATASLLHNPKVNISANIIIKYKVDFKLEEINGKRQMVQKYMYFYSKFAKQLKSPNQIKEWVENEISNFESFVQEQIERSDGVFNGIEEFSLQTGKTTKTRAGSFIKLNDILKNKKAFINVFNVSDKNDNKCIIWALLASMYKNDPKIKTCRYNETACYEKFLDLIKIPEGQTFPIDIKRDIPLFEKLNDIKINIFYYDKEDSKFNNLLVYYNNMDRNEKVHNLLLVENKFNKTDHFVCITDVGRLLRTESSRNKKYWCLQCLSKAYDTKEQLNEHYLLCNKHECIKAILPKAFDPLTDDIEKREDKVKFKNYNNTFEHPFTVLMDFEASLIKIDDDGIKRDKEGKIMMDKNKNEKMKQTIRINKHVVNSVGIKYNCIHEVESEKLVIYNNEDPEEVMKSTILELERLAIKSYDLLQRNKANIILTDEEQISYNQCLYCSSCKNVFKDKNKVRHHDHISGKYISALCKKCNLDLKYKNFMPVYLHNLKGYDSHFIVLALNKYGYQESKSDNISCIPSNEEKYISFSKEIKVGSYEKFNEQTKKMETKNLMFEIRFIDTLGFMATSLDNLTENLKSGCNGTKELRNNFKNLSEHFTDDFEFNLMCSKGVYPYEFIDNYNKLKDKQLPPIEAFYSRLNNSHCSEKDYKKAQLVWKTFKCKTILDYHNLYLTSDVLLLADIWGNFRKVCKRIYGLDSNYYYTAPGLSWDAFLKHTNEHFMKVHGVPFEIDLITDIDMYLLIENSIRGGLSQISKRYAKANNKYIEGYNKSLVDSYLLYLDANNLYGAAMCSYLPHKNFKWSVDEKWFIGKKLSVKDKKQLNKNISEIKDNAKIGYMFNVNLHYPDELHNLHNGYALAAENINIKNDMLNDFQQEGRKENNIKKLCTSFEDKINFGVNYRELKFFLKHGLKITKVNQVLEYEQLNYMESYIMKNTNERITAKNDFEKDFFKLMNNSVYGKTMENVRNRINFRLLSTEQQAKSIRNVRIRHTIFNDDLVGVHLCKQQVKLNKPIFIGQNVLDESKLIMQKFHYDFMLPKFGKENLDLLFTDTDSLCYHIKNINPYKVMMENKGEFDLASYPKDNILYDPTNNKVLKKMKDELSGKYMVEFVGLRPKCYAFNVSNGITKKTCKGVKKSVVDKEITFDDYNNTRKTGEIKEIKQMGFRSYKHIIYTEETTKKALTRNDDKVFILDDNINTLTLGHKDIKVYRELKKI